MTDCGGKINSAHLPVFLHGQWGGGGLGIICPKFINLTHVKIQNKPIRLPDTL